MWLLSRQPLLTTAELGNILGFLTTEELWPPDDKRQRSAHYIQYRPKSILPSDSKIIKFYWNKDTLIYLHTIDGCFHATSAELSPCYFHSGNLPKKFVDPWSRRISRAMVLNGSTIGILVWNKSLLYRVVPSCVGQSAFLVPNRIILLTPSITTENFHFKHSLLIAPPTPCWESLP